MHETTLDNGLTVLVQEVHTAPLASVWCWYRVGSRDEGPGVTGVSHWVEHMNFKGTTNIPRDQVKGIIERFGGSWNGYTWLDQTTYLETATADALDRMLFIEAERMASCLYDPADCESERTVIISELQGGENDPEQRLDTEITATAFKAHPVPPSDHRLDPRPADDDPRRPRTATTAATTCRTTPPSSSSATSTRPRRCAASRPPSAASRPATPARRAATEEPPQEGERRVHLRKPGTTAYWRAAFHAPRFDDPDFFPLLALDAVLTGASGLNIWSGGKVPTPQRRARLYRALVNRGLASSVGGFLAPTAEPFLYSISATVADGQSLAAVEDAVLAECDRVVRDGPTADELAVVQAQLRARFVYDADSVTDVAHQLGYFATIDRWQAWPEVFGAAGRGHRRRRARCAARRYLAADNRTIGVFEPTPAERVLMALDPHRRVLANGVTVVVQANRLIPAVSLAIGVNAGAVADPVEAPGTAALTARVLDRGTETLDADAIADRIESRGASLAAAAGRQQVIVERDLASSRTSTPCCRWPPAWRGPRRFPATTSPRGGASCSPRSARPRTTRGRWPSTRCLASCIPTRILSGVRCAAGRPPWPPSPVRTCRPSTGAGSRRRRRRWSRSATSTRRPPSTPSPRRSRTGARLRRTSRRSRRRPPASPPAGSCAGRCPTSRRPTSPTGSSASPGATPTTTRRW